MSRKVILRYYQGKEADMFTFYRIPKLLFTSECFSSISCEAKVLYGIMLDRMSLSIKNGWIDELDRPYIYFSLNDAIEYLKCGKNKAVKCMKELEAETGIGLIEKHKRGVGKTDIIYVKCFMVIEDAPGLKSKPDESDSDIDGQQPDTEEVSVHNTAESVENSHIEEDSDTGLIAAEYSIKPVDNMPDNMLSGLKSKPEEAESAAVRFKKQTPSGLKSKLRQVCFSNPNKTEINKTKYNNNNNPSHHIISAHDMTDVKSDKSDNEELTANARSEVRDRVNYDHLLAQYRNEAGIIDGICELLLEIKLNTSSCITVSGNTYAAEFVKDRFAMLKTEHIRYVMDMLLKNRSRISNIRNYLLAMLFNAPVTMDGYYCAEANHDMAQGII
jgi:hypothetical protein